jgi:hypothetical protein
VFVDEASMSTEPATLIPIMKGVSVGLTILGGVFADCVDVKNY